MYRPTCLRSAVVAAASSLTLISCAAPEPPTAGTSTAGSDLAAEAGTTEVAGPQPRLVLSDANSGRIDVVDLVTEETLESFDVQHPAALRAAGNRYVVATSSSQNTIHVLDPGSWTIDHGDHTHSYTKPPADLGHFDTMLEALSNGDVELSITAAPHPGMVVPVDDHFLVSEHDTVELRDDSGEIVTRFPTPCPGAEGAAGWDEQALMACDDGLFLASANGAEWTSEKVSYPDWITPHTRPTIFRKQDSSPIAVAAAGNTVLAFDPAARAWTRIATPDRALDVGISEDGTTAFVVLADGTFRVYTVATGTEIASTPVLAEPFDGRRTVATPQVLVSGKRAYVTDPAGARVQEIDYRDNARIARTLDVGFTVGSASVVGG